MLFRCGGIARVRYIPGGGRVGEINLSPMGKGPTAGFRIEGRPPLTIDKWPGGNYRTVSTDYFHTMNIPVAQGRAFNESDTETAPLVIIINQSRPTTEFRTENQVGTRRNRAEM